MGIRKAKKNETSFPMKQRPRRFNRKPRSRDKYWLENDRTEEEEGEWLPGLCVYGGDKNDG